jgi:hypothetical protein
VAIGHVKARLASEGEAVRFTHLEGEGTLVQAVGDVDLSLFEQKVRSGMAAAEAGG